MSVDSRQRQWSVCVLLSVGCLLCNSITAYAQQTEPAAAPEAGSQPIVAENVPDTADENAPKLLTGEERVVWRTKMAGEQATTLADVPTSELQLFLVPLTLEELETRKGEAMIALRTVADKLAGALIEQVRAVSAGELDADLIVELDNRIRWLREFRADLITRANLILKAIEVKGGDVAGDRAYVAVVEKLDPDPNLIAPTEAPISEEEQKKIQLAERVAAAITTVREMPPVHERPEPWTIPVRELELELQPLRMVQIQERVEKWLEILQRNVRQRIRMDIAVENAKNPDERQALADRSNEQQLIVNAIVERVNVALLSMQRRGGDVREYNDYVGNATGQKLNLSDPAVLMAQIKAWVRSPDGGVKIGLNILKFLGILIVFWIASKIIGGLVGAAARRVPKTSSLLHSVLSSMTRRIILIIGIVVAISMLGININPLIAAIGAAGLVIGLALQGTLSNFASGILILITRPFDVGDVINGGGVVGKVDAMNLVSTRILTFDNQVMLVPNNQIWNGVITNVTALSTRRVDLVMGIGYSDDIDKAQAVIEEVISKHEKVLETPAPTIKVHELADNSVNFIVRPWSRTADYWDVYWDLTRDIKKRFDEEGINIPYPQRDLHLSGPIEVVTRTEGQTATT